MSKSQETKVLIAQALKELMPELPFDKISVTRICQEAQVHRKTFYYHFQDKYDLVNWIYDTEVAELKQLDQNSRDPEEVLAFFKAICHYLYNNRAFYHKALQIEGQNSFLDHFYSLTRPLVRERLALLMGTSKIDDFTTDFFTDAIVAALENWLLQKHPMTADDFIHRVLRIIHTSAETIAALDRKYAYELEFGLKNDQPDSQG
ncbi:MAG: TetR/AcrR family transcriptional regulator C-terminal domain-containing protein [Eubacteriales bacterium]|nr:TetR/AcrR family transcriptional regulator C-terminal domain-containing protein [Eubacteriales bacterium]